MTKLNPLDEVIQEMENEKLQDENDDNQFEVTTTDIRGKLEDPTFLDIEEQFLQVREEAKRYERTLEETEESHGENKSKADIENEKEMDKKDFKKDMNERER